MNRTSPHARPRGLTTGTPAMGVIFAGTIFALSALTSGASADPRGNMPLQGTPGDEAHQAQAATVHAGTTVLTDAELDDVTAGFLSGLRFSISSFNSSIRSATRSVGNSVSSSCAAGNGAVFGNCSSYP
jgi:hypothetical protein